MATPRLDRRQFADLTTPRGVARVRVMAEAEGYAMVRHAHCLPFVVLVKALTRPEPPDPRDNDAARLGSDLGGPNT